MRAASLAKWNVTSAETKGAFIKQITQCKELAGALTDLKSTLFTKEVVGAFRDILMPILFNGKSNDDLHAILRSKSAAKRETLTATVCAMPRVARTFSRVSPAARPSPSHLTLAPRPHAAPRATLASHS